MHPQRRLQNQIFSLMDIAQARALLHTLEWLLKRDLAMLISIWPTGRQHRTGHLLTWGSQYLRMGAQWGLAGNSPCGYQAQGNLRHSAGPDSVRGRRPSHHSLRSRLQGPLTWQVWRDRDRYICEKLLVYLLDGVLISLKLVRHFALTYLTQTSTSVSSFENWQAFTGAYSWAAILSPQTLLVSDSSSLSKELKRIRQAAHSAGSRSGALLQCTHQFSPNTSLWAASDLRDQRLPPGCHLSQAGIIL